MKGEDLQRYARVVAASLDGTSSGRPFTPTLDVWKVRRKVFLVVTEDDPDLQIVTVKVDPLRGDALRREVDGITTGRYFNKQHWISVGPGMGVTKQLILELVHDSYDLVDDRTGRSDHG